MYVAVERRPGDASGRSSSRGRARGRGRARTSAGRGDTATSRFDARARTSARSARRRTRARRRAASGRSTSHGSRCAARTLSPCRSWWSSTCSPCELREQLAARRAAASSEAPLERPARAAPTARGGSRPTRRPRPPACWNGSPAALPEPRQQPDDDVQRLVGGDLSQRASRARTARAASPSARRRARAAAPRRHRPRARAPPPRARPRGADRSA